MRLVLQIVLSIVFIFELGSAQTLVGNFDCLEASAYTLCQNLWNAMAGNQTSTLISSFGNAVSWSTNWTWANQPSTVTSYANILSNTAKGKQLSDIEAAPSTWCWWYQSQSSDIQAGVTYDVWLGEDSSGKPASSETVYEITISLSELGGIHGAGALNTSGIYLAGHTWDLWKRPRSGQSWEILSFVTAEGDINDFDADLNVFFKYLIKNQGVPPSQFVQDIQAGNEAFKGTAVLVTERYSVELK